MYRKRYERRRWSKPKLQVHEVRSVERGVCPIAEILRKLLHPTQNFSEIGQSAAELWPTKTIFTSSSAVAERPRDALCPSVVSLALFARKQVTICVNVAMV